MNHHQPLADELDGFIDRSVDFISMFRTWTSDETLIRAFANANCDVIATLAWTSAVFEGDEWRAKAAEGRIRPTPVWIGGAQKNPLSEEGSE
jgi:hypothetical protein